MNKPRIIFFGTGPVSLATLEGIHQVFEVEAIITKPDRVSPSGRTHDHPVKQFGADHSIPVHQVATEHMLQELVVQQRFTSRVGLVVDFGMIIPAQTIDAFELGIVNSHFSLLPQLRGADPITFAILEGLKTTGVSLMTIVPALDEGDILVQQEYTIPAGATTPDLTDALVELSNQMLIEDLPRYIEGQLPPAPQEGVPTYTRKLTKTDGEIDWQKPAIRLEREVRAYSGWPGSRTQLLGKEVIVTASHVLVGNPPTDGESTPGRVITHDNVLQVAAGDGGWLAIDRLKPAGKREMDAAEFLRGIQHS